MAIGTKKEQETVLSKIYQGISVPHTGSGFTSSSQTVTEAL